MTIDGIKTKKAPTPPWRKKNPRKGKGSKLSPAQVAMARERAAQAGRPYPNLIDNMWASQQRPPSEPAPREDGED